MSVISTAAADCSTARESLRNSASLRRAAPTSTQAITTPPDSRPHSVRQLATGGLASRAGKRLRDRHGAHRQPVSPCPASRRSNPRHRRPRHRSPERVPRHTRSLGMTAAVRSAGGAPRLPRIGTAEKRLLAAHTQQSLGGGIAVDDAARLVQHRYADRNHVENRLQARLAGQCSAASACQRSVTS
jgi:hypothetical protein